MAEKSGKVIWVFVVLLSLAVGYLIYDQKTDSNANALTDALISELKSDNARLTESLESARSEVDILIANSGRLRQELTDLQDVISRGSAVGDSFESSHRTARATINECLVIVRKLKRDYTEKSKEALSSP
jgi:hypothetical protein